MTIYFLNIKKFNGPLPIFVNTFLLGHGHVWSFLHCPRLFWQYGDRVEEMEQRTGSLQSLKYHLVLDRKTLPPPCSEETVLLPQTMDPLSSWLLCYVSIHPLSSHIFMFSFSSQFFFQGSTWVALTKDGSIPNSDIKIPRGPVSAE